MPTTNQIVAGQQIFGAAVGFPKSGKTVNLCTFPGKIKVWDIDKRINSVNLMHPNRNNIHYDQYGVDDYELLENDINRDTEDKSFGMYILDSLTSCADMVICYSMKLRGVGKDARIGRAKGKIQLTEVEDFGAEAAGLQKIIMALHQVKHAHVFVTMHILRTSAWSLTENKEIVMSTILTGGKKVAAKVPTLFNEIWAFQSVPGLGVGAPSSFYMHTSPTIDVPTAGTTLPLPPRIECTLPKFNLWSQIESNLKARNALPPVK